MGDIRIELQNITKSYYSETSVTQALQKVNLTFKMGEFVAITGESGSGKSTLLNIIGGIDSYDDGEMIVDGKKTFQYDDKEWEEYRRNKIGYIFQDYSLISHYTVLDNITSALSIMGYEYNDAKKTAMEYLDQVGLAEYANHKGSELSSGQKQRLSIARALAKNTGIILADEPTGNLDTETGNQIIQLLSQIAKDKLVIMVTHNYDQAEPYVTRKIQLYDGVIVNDLEISKNDNDTEEIEKSYDIDAKDDLKAESKTSLMFAFRNIKTQPGRVILFTIFLLIISSASFVFIGELFSHIDDYSTRSYSQSAFYKQDDKRLVVKRQDGKEITDLDRDILSSLDYVETVDSCDLANDINYYIDKDKDYTFLYGDSRRKRRRFFGKEKEEEQQEETSSEETKTLSFKNENRFMQSVDCISKDDLLMGDLPKDRNEIVLYSDDKSVLDTTKVCYFQAKNIWAQGQYYSCNVKIVGILKEKTDQVYFSKEMCRMLSMHKNSATYRLLSAYDSSYGDYRIKAEVVPVINDDLFGNRVKVSKYLENAPNGFCPLSIQYHTITGEDDGPALQYTIEVDGEKNEQTSMFIEMSPALFERYYDIQSKQASVYIVNYAKTDAVIKAIENEGYKAISTYRISMLDYSKEPVIQRLTIIGISAFGLLLLLVSELLILRAMMKIRIKEYFVLKFIGAKLSLINKISYFEMGIYTLVAMIITVILAFVLRSNGVKILDEIMWYYEWPAYLSFVVYNIVLILLTVFSFNRLLKGRLKQ